MTIQTATAHAAPNTPALSGVSLVLAGLILAMANFMAVLDTSIANVALPHIAGGLGASSSEGTSVITFYAIAEAIGIPLTGWLANRFGSVRVFLVAMTGFGISSIMCGLSGSLDMLIVFRAVQGFCAGPMMPLSQSLLLRIVPRRSHPIALALWSMTVIVAPIAGPLLGGIIADGIGWQWSFYLNVPVAIVSVAFGWRLLLPHETPIERSRVDLVGFVLLSVWVGALQLMLDNGKEKDWFESDQIVQLGLVAAIVFVAFVIWELTEKKPIVDLRIFGNINFSLATGVMAIAYGIFFGSVVLVPLWLQNNLGYTATWSGYLTAFNGILGVLVSPLVAKLIVKHDPRLIAWIGVTGLACVLGARSLFSTSIAFEQMIPAQLGQGLFLPLMFVPMLGIALTGVPEAKLASASGLMTFARTMAGAVATSVVTSVWERTTASMRSELIAAAPHQSSSINFLAGTGPEAQGVHAFSRLIDEQAMMLSTNQLFAFVGGLLAGVALLIWCTRRPPTDAGGNAQLAH